MTDKTPNYTEEMVAKMVEAYEESPNRDRVEALAHEFGKSYRSVVAKLSSLGIYKPEPRATKTGEPIVKKETLVAEICEALGVKADSLIKANKRDLETISKAVRNL